MTAPIRRRTRAREIAMQALYQFDLRRRDEPHELAATAAGMGSDIANAAAAAIEQVCAQELFAIPDDDDDRRPAAPADGKLGKGDRDLLRFATRLVEGTLSHRDEIDQRLQSVTRNWDLRRMAIVDRNVLRMAVYELMFCTDVPPKVAINEAIEIGKKYSTANSGGFVNGILDRIRIDIEQERRQPPRAAAADSASDADS